VSHSVVLNVKEEVLFSNKNETGFILDMNAFIKNNESLSKLEVDDIIYNNFMLNRKLFKKK
jgi:hypothetical protein